MYLECFSAIILDLFTTFPLKVPSTFFLSCRDFSCNSMQLYRTDFFSNSLSNLLATTPVILVRVPSSISVETTNTRFCQPQVSFCAGRIEYLTKTKSPKNIFGGYLRNRRNLKNVLSNHLNVQRGITVEIFGNPPGKISEGIL